MSLPDFGGVRLVDSFGRAIEDMRISVTDRCNFRCTYCMPEEGMTWLANEKLLTFEEIGRLSRIAVALGIRELRLIALHGAGYKRGLRAKCKREWV